MKKDGGKEKITNMKTFGNLFKKIIACLILIAMFAGYVVPVGEVLGNTAQNTAGSSYIERLVEEANEKLEDEFGNEELTSLDDSIVPISFDLRDYINIKVEDQGIEGLCWDFATLSALETHLALTRGLDYDFSEAYLAYITSNEFNENKNREIGKGLDIDEACRAIRYYGIVLEEDFPYSELRDPNIIKAWAHLGKLGDIDKVILKSFPNISKTTYKGKVSYNRSPENVAEIRNEIKKHIMEKGGIYASIDWIYFGVIDRVWRLFG